MYPVFILLLKCDDVSALYDCKSITFGVYWTFIRQNKQFYDFFFEILETLYIKVLVIRVS